MGPEKGKAEIPVCMQNACACVCVCVSVNGENTRCRFICSFCERFPHTTFDCSDSLKKIATAHLNTHEIILKTKNNEIELDHET